MITVNADNKIEINLDKLKSKPNVISLIESINNYGINIDNLTNMETSKLISMVLIASR